MIGQMMAESLLPHSRFPIAPLKPSGGSSTPGLPTGNACVLLPIRWHDARSFLCNLTGTEYTRSLFSGRYLCGLSLSSVPVFPQNRDLILSSLMDWTP